MDQNHPRVTTEKLIQLPILIIDKKGMIGDALQKKLREQLLTVFVTSSSLDSHDNLIGVSWRKRLPTVPDNMYSHIFVVYNGEKEILDMLPGFVQKARESKGKVIFITSLPASSIKLFAYLQHQGFQDVQIVLYGETFGPQSTDVNEMNFLLNQVKTYGRIELTNAGLDTLYPILIEDVIRVIQATAFANQYSHRIVFAFPHHPFSQISIARILQKLDPLLKTDYKKGKHVAREYYIPQGGVYYFQDYDIEGKLRTIDLTRTGSRNHVPQKKAKLHLPDPEASRKRLILVGTLLSSLFIAPIVITLFFMGLGAGFLTLSFSQAEQGKFDRAEQTASIAQSSFHAANELLPGLVLISAIAPTQHAQLQNTVTVGEEVSEAEGEILHALVIMKNIYEKKSLDPKNDFYRALATVKNTLITVQKMEAEEQLPVPVLDLLKKYNGVLQLVEGTIDTWPSLLGFEGKRTYLLLFQNNMELRPGGGFIGSYGIVTLQNGQMDKIQINDVYDADGQLKQKIEPPYGLKRYLGASNWFLRDSNFDVDYPRNAVQAAQFLKLETGQNVDGVIAIDTTFLKDIIGALGSVTVPDYEETVTADTFYLMTQNHAEKDFFPGSRQKKDFLRSLSNALMIEIFEKKNFSYEKMLLTIESSIRQKHLLMAFSDEGTQTVFSVNGLSSTVKDGRVGEKNTFLDFFGVVDANVGTNKSNYYLKRSMIQQVAFDGAGGLQVTAEVSYVNASKQGSLYGGNYNNFVRFLIPQEAVLQDIALDNVSRETIPAITDSSIYRDEAFIQPRGLEVEQTEVLGKKSIGFFFIVPPGQSKTVKLTYTIPDAVNLRDSSFKYNMRLFKQPGAGEDPYTLYITYPSGFKPIAGENAAMDLGGKLVYDIKFNKDTDLSIGFSKR